MLKYQTRNNCHDHSYNGNKAYFKSEHERKSGVPRESLTAGNAAVRGGSGQTEYDYYV